MVKVKAHMVKWSPQSFRNHQSGPLKKFDHVYTYGPSTFKVVTFDPFEVYFGNMATEAPHHLRNATNNPWILLLWKWQLWSTHFQKIQLWSLG